MLIHRGLAQLGPPPGGSAVTIGTFDGVHLGHRALIAATVAEARRLGVTPALVTWDRHPAATLRPEAVPPSLTTLGRKVELIAQAGIGVLALLAFDDELSSWPPERFVDEVLVAGLGARAVLVGRGWRFGHRAAGDVELLCSLGAQRGFSARAVDLIEGPGGPVSSSRIRAALAAGDLATARALMGRPYEIEGVVIPGDGRGAGLGYPTANLAVDPALARPPLGIYAGRARARGAFHPAAISIGVNPTFASGGGVRVEAYLLDFSGDLYGCDLRLELWARLRAELRFDSVAALTQQMARDVAATRALTC